MLKKVKERERERVEEEGVIDREGEIVREREDEREKAGWSKVHHLSSSF